MGVRIQIKNKERVFIHKNGQKEIISKTKQKPKKKKDENIQHNER